VHQETPAGFVDTDDEATGAGGDQGAVSCGLHCSLAAASDRSPVTEFVRYATTGDETDHPGRKEGPAELFTDTRHRDRTESETENWRR